MILTTYLQDSFSSPKQNLGSPKRIAVFSNLKYAPGAVGTGESGLAVIHGKTRHLDRRETGGQNTLLQQSALCFRFSWPNQKGLLVPRSEIKELI
ncbi:hypothetical protein AB3480_27200 [Rhizobium mongolense]|uniref:hypothetical protein n=1 Tax=Rhizobium mongolense TaxID=57676 RepID=UPI0034A131AD